MNYAFLVCEINKPKSKTAVFTLALMERNTLGEDVLFLLKQGLEVLFCLLIGNLLTVSHFAN